MNDNMPTELMERQIATLERLPQVQSIRDLIAALKKALAARKGA